MSFSFVKPTAREAVASAVRLSQTSTSVAAVLPAGRSFGQPAPALPASATNRGRHRAEKSRYQAQCRRAMSF